MAVCFCILGGLLLWRHKPIYFWFLGIGALFGIAGLAAPVSLRYINMAWMKLAAGLGWLNSRIILSVFYFIIFTPVGFVARIIGKDMLDISWKRKRESYWIPAKEETDIDKKRYERMF